jgi:hypothetical protein
MLRRSKIAVAASAVLVAAMAITVTYVWSARHRGPTSDEFLVYTAFLSQLSKDETLPLDHFALADTSFKLVPAAGENWIPAELKPYPPDEAEASERFIDFCGAFCGRDFMTKNLHAWRLKPTSTPEFAFDIIPAPAESSSAGGGKRVVTVTRPGFDLWHHRAVFTYSFDCSAGATPAQDAVMCVQFGQVLLERINGRWQVASYSAFDV